jgi:8-oxo-dGTP pyrophosphatase MutT (NUDIX family)
MSDAARRRPRPAATICVFRDSPDGVEILMVQRGATARFMAGAWVFPGGAVDELDDGPDAREACTGDVDDEIRPWMAAALRELIEETQVWIAQGQVTLAAPEPFLKDDEVYPHALATGRRLDLSRLGYFANWITPTMVPVRFDTRFFAAVVEPGTAAHPDPSELDAVDWVRPAEALARAEAGSWVVPFPTQKTLGLFTGFATAAEVMSHIDGIASVPAVTPRMRLGDDGGLEVVLPGEPGFDDLSDEGPDPDALKRAAAAGGTRVPEIETEGDGVADAR